jgi:hypothetical protein
MTLFDCPPTAPALPTPGTLADKALALLRAGAEIDHPTFEALTGSWRLAAVVFELRVLGWPIEATDCPTTTKGTTRHVALYRMAVEVLQ